ncbi:hypothetical protein EJ110_NYTH51543 [Nymphaea thermarum]|nr:hypothetical protein EJ110_NYTH51543 [Nymphaea thermarum]
MPTRDSKPISTSWKDPYGITFPGKPSGRFSDGRVLINYVAAYMGIPTRITCRTRHLVAGMRKYLGMNFAYGGTGVLDTLVPLPIMITQIDSYEQLIQLGDYIESDLNSSIALVSVAGNDYDTQTEAPWQSVKNLVGSVLNQTAVNLKGILGLGVPKVAVMGLPPKAVDAINATFSHPSAIAILELYAPFTSSLQGSKLEDGGAAGGERARLLAAVASTTQQSTKDAQSKVVPSLLPSLQRLMSV